MDRKCWCNRGGRVCGGIGLETESQDVISLEFSGKGCTGVSGSAELVTTGSVKYMAKVGGLEVVGKASVLIFKRPILNYEHSWTICGPMEFPGEISL